MSKENKNDLTADVSSHSDNKPLSEIEYLEYVNKKARTVRKITYPDGSEGELHKGVVILL